jgi:methylmalonyl-CoA/ethylmalonyl-CoA epimerase
MKMHHVGFAVPAIDDVLAGFCDSLSARGHTDVYHDPVQRVRVVFLIPEHPDAARIELIEPDGERSPVAAFVSRGGGLHHVCYEVPNLEEQLRTARAAKGVVIRSPVPAVAFAGRRIAWVLTKEKLLIEYLESGPASQA